MRAALLGLLLCSPARAGVELADLDAYSDPETRLLKIDQALRKGFWNARIHAVHNLAPHGLNGLPFLEWAAEDADWQVRLTAVHYLGRLGSPGIPALSAVLRREPCRHVRLSAVHWLGSMGPEASPVLQQALKDESGMLRLMNRYWLEKIGTPAPPQPRFEEKTEMDAAKKEDLKRCLSSQIPGRAKWAAVAPVLHDPAEEEAEAAAAAALEEGALLSPAPAPGADRADGTPESLPPLAKLPARTPAPPPKALPPPPGEEERYRELDSLLSMDEQEFPAPAEMPGRAGPERPGARLEPVDRLEEGLSLDAGPEGTPESFPSGGPGRAPAPEYVPGAVLEADAGRGKAEHDPLPALLAGLEDADPRRRWRSADELGKLGAQAKDAVKALAAALKDPEARVRASAALALGNIGAGADRSVKALVRLLKDPNEEVQLNAALALGRMGTARSRKAFRRHLKAQAEAIVRPGR